MKAFYGDNTTLETQRKRLKVFKLVIYLTCAFLVLAYLEHPVRHGLPHPGAQATLDLDISKIQFKTMLHVYCLP